MAKIPDASSIGRLIPSGAIGSPRASTPKITGYSELADVAAQTLNNYREDIGKFNYLKAQTELDKSHNEAILAIDQEPDYTKHEKIYQQYMDSSSKKLTSGLFGRYRDNFELQYQDRLSSGITKVKLNVNEKIRDRQEADFIGMSDDILNEAITTKDPDRMAELQNRYVEAVNSVVKYNDTAKVKTIQGFGERLATGRIEFMNADELRGILSRFKQDGTYQKGGDIFDNVRPDTLKKVAGSALTSNLRFQKDALMVQRGGLYASGDLPLNHRDDESKKSFNAYYSNLINSTEFDSAPAGDKIQAIGTIVSNAKFIPEALKGDLMSSAISKDPSTVEYAASVINYIEDLNPNLSPSLGGREIERLRDIASMIRSNIPAIDAIEAVDFQRSPENQASMKKIEQELKDLDFDYRSKVKTKFDPWFGSLDTKTQLNSEAGVGALDKAEIDFRVSFENHYKRTRNSEVAQRRALQDSLEQYGRSEVNPEPILTKYPVERYYSIKGLDSSWILEQARDEIRNLNKTRMDPIPEDKINKIYIVADPIRTARTISSGRPAYKLMYIDNGVVKSAIGDNAYVPDPEAYAKAIIDGKRKVPSDIIDQIPLLEYEVNRFKRKVDESTKEVMKLNEEQ
jgi:hypothetical protein